MSRNNSCEETNGVYSFKTFLNLPNVDSILLSWILGVTYAVMTAFIFIGNGLVAFAILMDPLRTIRRHLSNHFVLSLAVADFLVGVKISLMCAWWFFGVALYKMDVFDVIKGRTGVKDMDLVAVSTFNMFALGVDRLIAIQTPMRYSYRVTKRKVRITIVCIWGYFTVLSILLLFFDPCHLKREFILNCHGTVAFFALAFVCILSIYFLHKQSNATTKRFESSVFRKTMVEREKKATKTFILLILIFSVVLSRFSFASCLSNFVLVCTIH